MKAYPGILACIVLFVLCSSPVNEKASEVLAVDEPGLSGPVTVPYGHFPPLPSMVKVVLNDNSRASLPVLWNSDAVNPVEPGDYMVHGTLLLNGKKISHRDLEVLVRVQDQTPVPIDPQEVRKISFLAHSFDDHNRIQYTWMIDTANGRFYEKKMEGFEYGYKIITNKSEAESLRAFIFSRTGHYPEDMSYRLDGRHLVYFRYLLYREAEYGVFDDMMTLNIHDEMEELTPELFGKYYGTKFCTRAVVGHFEFHHVAHYYPDGPSPMDYQQLVKWLSYGCEENTNGIVKGYSLRNTFGIEGVTLPVLNPNTKEVVDSFMSKVSEKKFPFNIMSRAYKPIFTEEQAMVAE